MHRHTARARGGFFSAVHQGVQGLDGFVRRYGHLAKDAASVIAPALLKAGQPALAAGVATVGQGMDSCANLHNQLG